MKYIITRAILCTTLIVFSLYAGAQSLSDGEDEAEMDSLATAGKGQVQVAYRKVNPEDLLGGVSFVNVAELMEKNYLNHTLENMEGYVGGWNGGGLWAMDDYLVLVDGVPRDANNVMPSEVEQVTFLKGASAVVLYGSRAAKGVVYITTKKGHIGKNRIDVRGNTGFYVPKSYPKYLGSAEYMTLYNEARFNDGLDPVFSAEDIYNHASGVNPYRYPDVNLYSSEYLKKSQNLSEGSVEISGGTQRARFYTNLNLYNANSLLKYADAAKDHTTRYSVRGNIDVELNQYVRSHVNANATFHDARLSNGDFWGAASTLRPNRISPLIPVSLIDEDNSEAWAVVKNSNNLIDGKYLLGGNQLNQTNELANLYAAGYSTYTSRQYQFDTGIDVDLQKVLKGLSFQTQFAIDYSTSYISSYTNSYATYEPVWGNYNGRDVILSLNKYGMDEKDGVQNVTGSWNRQTIAFSGQFNYNTVIDGSHNISAMLVAAGYQQSDSEVYHRNCNANLGFQADYNYRHRYYATLGGAVVHSARLPEGNRQAFSPSVTLGWKLSEEGFLKDSPVIDNLMLTASASILNTDLDINDYYLYEAIYDQTDGAWWGWADGNANQATQSRRGGNKKMSFIKRKEVSVGLRGALWQDMLNFDLSFFTNRMEGLLTQASSLFPGYFSIHWPESSFIPYLNYNNYDRKGFDFSANFKKQVHEAELGFGVSGTYNKTKVARLEEIHEYDYQYRKGTPINGIWGLVSDGFFTSEEDIVNSSTQTFGEVKRGDIKYVDQNKDGVIDEQDMIYLGKRWDSPFTLGVNFTAKWKGFTLFALGTGYFGGSGMKSGSYYWVSGDDKYSEVVRNRWTEATSATATYPRLTTQSGGNNFRESDFWLYKTDRFNIARVQLTYDFPESMFHNTVISSLAVYAGGTDLITISKERKTLELNAGISPQCRYYNIGFKIGF